MDSWMPYLAWLGPPGILALAYGLKKLRQFIVASRKPVVPPEPPPAPPETPSLVPVPDNPPVGSASASPGGIPDSAMYITAPPSATQDLTRYQIESYYSQFKQTRQTVETSAANARQLAQFKAVEQNTPILLTLYDPADVPMGSPLFRLEAFPLDDMRRQPNSGHPAAGCGTDSDVVELDFRVPVDEMIEGFSPTHFQERYAALAKRRLAVYDDKPKLEKDISSFEGYSKRNRAQAAKDLEELLPKILEDAKKIARDKFITPERLVEFAKEADERNTTVEVITDEFIMAVGDQAVKAARDRFDKAGPLDESNDLLKAFTKERLASSSAWIY